jgi:hypothetical protein
VIENAFTIYNNLNMLKYSMLRLLTSLAAFGDICGRLISEGRSHLKDSISFQRSMARFVRLIETLTDQEITDYLAAFNMHRFKNNMNWKLAHMTATELVARWSREKLHDYLWYNVRTLATLMDDDRLDSFLFSKFELGDRDDALPDFDVEYESSPECFELAMARDAGVETAKAKRAAYRNSKKLSSSKTFEKLINSQKAKHVDALDEFQDDLKNTSN